MHFEENEITESSKPSKGQKIILGFCFALGLLIAGLILLSIIFEIFSDFHFKGPHSSFFADMIEMFTVFLSGIFIVFGSFKMWSGIEKGCAPLFIGSFVVIFFLAWKLRKSIYDLITIDPDQSINLVLLKILIILVFLFFGGVSVWLLSPPVRKFCSQKNMTFGFLMSGFLCLALIGAEFLQNYF